MRARLLDVIGAEAPVEADRGVELAEDRVLGLGEARHTGIMPGMELVVRAARPEDPAAGSCTCPPRRTTTQYAGGEARARRLLAPSTRTGSTPRAGRSATWR